MKDIDALLMSTRRSDFLYPSAVARFPKPEHVAGSDRSLRKCRMGLVGSCLGALGAAQCPRAGRSRRASCPPLTACPRRFRPPGFARFHSPVRGYRAAPRLRIEDRLSTAFGVGLRPRSWSGGLAVESVDAIVTQR